MSEITSQITNAYGSDLLWGLDFGLTEIHTIPDGDLKGFGPSKYLWTPSPNIGGGAEEIFDQPLTHHRDIGADGEHIDRIDGAIPTTVGAYSYIHLVRPENFDAVGTRRLLEHVDLNSTASNPLRFWVSSGKLAFYDGTDHVSTRTPGFSESLFGWSVDYPSSQVVFYENGLPFASFSLGSSVDFQDGSPFDLSVASYPDGQNGTENAKGHHFLAFMVDQALTHGEMLDEFERWSDTRHWIKYTLEEDLGLTTVGTAGDMIFHFPLMENDNDTTFQESPIQTVDVSMYENHGEFEGDVLMGRDPSSFGGAMYSLDTSNGGVVNVSNILDPAVTSITIYTRFLLKESSTEGVWGRVDDSIVLYVPPSGQLTFELSDGTNTVQVISSADTITTHVWYRVVCRFDRAADTMDMWLDGVHIGQADTSGLTLASATSDFKIGDAGSRASMVGRLELPTAWSTALTATNCLDLSGS